MNLPIPSVGRMTPEWADRLLRQLTAWAQALLRTEQALYFLLFVLLGAMGGLVGVTFRWLGVGFQALLFSSGGSLLDAARSIPWYMRLVTPAGGALLAGLVIHYLLRGSSGSGMSEIMEAVALRERTLSLRASLLKSLAALFLMSSGGSVGREGPISALSAAIATRVGQILNITPARRNILIGCGVAAGMAAVYNAPLGAALFVMEVVIANFAMDVFGPLVAAALTATLISRALGDPGPLYAVPSFMPAGVAEYFLLGLLGVPCALAGIFFAASIDRVNGIFQGVKLHPAVKITLGGLLLGGLGIWLPHAWGNGYDAVAGTLNGRFPLNLLIAICLAKILATSVSLGSGGLGGVMTPSLLIGASLGGVMGHLLPLVGYDQASPPGAYALVGMAGLLAATTHAPIMATFLTFELCQDYGMILPLGACAGVAALVARSLRKESIYSERLARKGLDLDAVIEQSALQAISVEDVVWRNPPTVPPGMPARAVMERFLQSRRHLMHVVGEDQTYYGLILMQDCIPTAEQSGLEQLVVAMDLARPLPSVAPDDPISAIMERFWFQEFGELPVLSRGDPPRFLGVVTRRDVLGAFDREVLRRRILTARYRTGPDRPTAALPLVGDYAVEEIPVPQALHGRTLAQAALPRDFHLTALAIKRTRDGKAEEIIPPPADHALAEGDRLVLMGRKADLASFARQ